MKIHVYDLKELERCDICVTFPAATSIIVFERAIISHRNTVAVSQCPADFKVMASQDRATDDDHVAQLLAKEAKEASKRYSELGVRALLPTR